VEDSGRMAKSSPTLHPILPQLAPLPPLQPPMDFSVIFSGADSQEKEKKSDQKEVEKKQHVWPAERAFHDVYEWDRKSRQKYFCYPVDPIADGAPLYFSQIKRPMDFSTIFQKLQTSKTKLSTLYVENETGVLAPVSGYKEEKELVDDVHLVFMNALAFNPPEHPVSKCARKRWEFFDKMRHLYLSGPSTPNESLPRKRKHSSNEEPDAAPLSSSTQGSFERESPTKKQRLSNEEKKKEEDEKARQKRIHQGLFEKNQLAIEKFLKRHLEFTQNEQDEIAFKDLCTLWITQNERCLPLIYHLQTYVAKLPNIKRMANASIILHGVRFKRDPDLDEAKKRTHGLVQGNVIVDPFLRVLPVGLTDFFHQHYERTNRLDHSLSLLRIQQDFSKWSNPCAAWYSVEEVLQIFAETFLTTWHRPSCFGIREKGPQPPFQ
jgi:hypothetical protein